MGKYEVVVIHEHRYTIETDNLEKAMHIGGDLADPPENTTTKRETSNTIIYNSWIKHQTTFGNCEETDESEMW